MRRRAVFFSVVLLWLGAACAPPTSPSGPAASAEPVRPARTLVAAINNEPKSLAARIIAQTAVSLHLRRIFNADLALLDDQSSPSAYLAEALPQLSTDSWRVFPNGTMETTYRLRPNLRWHDGTPFTADAFVFGWQVYTMPDIGQAGSLPFKLIASVEAPDDRTVLIRWKEPYAAAGALQSLGFSAAIGLPPLPRHILGSTYDMGSALGVINHSHWTTEYVGVGPYRLDRWEPGAFIEASAFDAHALGVPKIQHIKMVFLNDSNAGLAAVLAGDVQFANVPLAQAMTFLRERPNGRGLMVPYFNQFLAAHFQGRSDVVSPAALQDRRVRQALAYTVDRPAFNDALFEGQLPIADSIFPSTTEIGRAANAAAVKYPYDPTRSAQLMSEAGFTKPPGGEFYVGSSGERFSPELRGSLGSEFEPLTAAMASSWRKDGFDFQLAVIRLAQDTQVKSSFTGLVIGTISGGEGGLAGYGSTNIPRAENGWRGSSWEGYSNPELDRLLSVFSTALDSADRGRIAAEVVKVFTTDLPVISLFFPITPHVFTSDLVGPKLRPATSNPTWNVHDWELK